MKKCPILGQHNNWINGNFKNKSIEKKPNLNVATYIHVLSYSTNKRLSTAFQSYTFEAIGSMHEIPDPKKRKEVKSGKKQILQK